MSAVHLPGERHIAGGALITAVSQILSMALGGVLAVVIVLKFGKTPAVDGLFAAYGVYGLMLVLAQSLRTTVVARLVEGGSAFANLDRFTGAALLTAAIGAIPLVVLGDPTADLLTADLGERAHDTARTTLALLWIAGAAQLLAGLAAAALGVTGRFAVPGLAWVLGGTLAVAAVVALGDSAGIEIVPIAVVCGSTLTAAIMFGGLLRAGYRPRLAEIVRGALALRTTGIVVVGSIGFVISQLTYLVSIVFVARLGEGMVTLYSYAFFAAGVVVALTSGAVGTVIAAPLSEWWDRRPENLTPHLARVLHAGTPVVAAVIGTAAVAGDDVVDAVLGASLSEADGDAVAGTFVGLGGMLLSSVAGAVPGVAIFAASRYRLAAAVSGLAGIAHVGLTAVAASTDKLVAIGIATSASTLVSLVLLVAAVYGRGLLQPLGLVASDAARVGTAALVAFVPAWLAAQALGGLWALPAAVAGAGAFALLMPRFLPVHWALARELLLRGLARGR